MMEEKQISDSMATITIKPDYPSSEYCSSEAPPAYHKPQSSAVQVAKIVAVTVVVVSFVLGCFILASAYVTASASCRQLEQDLELLSEVADRFDGNSNNNNNNNQEPLQPEALIREAPATKQKFTSNQKELNPKKNIQEIDENKIDNSDSKDDDASNDSDEDVDENQQKVHFKLPLQLDFDDLAGALIAKNQRSKMNCIVEKKRAEEFVDHQPKTVRLPFGLNLTTDPRFERITGERMVIICESGHMQSAQPPQQADKAQQEYPSGKAFGNTNEVDDDDDDDDEQETIMIQPVMIPIPQTHFQTHMPQQMLPIEQQQQQQQQQQPMRPQIQIRPLHPMETMRPPMPPMRQEPMEHIRPPPQQLRPIMQNGFPMRPPSMEQNSGPVEPVMNYRQYGNMEPPRQSLEFQRPPPPMEMEAQQQQQQPQAQRTHHMMFIPQQLHIRLEPQIPFPPQRQQPQEEEQESSPNPIIQHIIQQIIAQKIQESRKLHEQQQQQQQQQQQEAPQGPKQIDFIEPRPDAQEPEQHIMYRPMMPLPEEVLTNLNRLPNTDRVIVAVSEPDSVEDNFREESSEESGENSHETVASPTLSISIQPHLQQGPPLAAAAPAATVVAPTQEPASTSSSQKSSADMVMMNAGNNGETYLRRLPVDIPVNMMQSQLHDQEQEPEAVASEETRPHYVQPRSVSIEEPKSRVTRSVNPLTPSKKVKRCACECAC